MPSTSSGRRMTQPRCVELELRAKVAQMNKKTACDNEANFARAERTLQREIKQDMLTETNKESMARKAMTATPETSHRYGLKPGPTVSEQVEPSKRAGLRRQSSGRFSSVTATPGTTSPSCTDMQDYDMTEPSTSVQTDRSKRPSIGEKRPIMAEKRSSIFKKRTVSYRSLSLRSDKFGANGPFTG